MPRAQAIATAHPGVRALSVDDLLADDAVDLVLNLTIPAAHAEVALQAIAAGKSVYVRKAARGVYGGGPQGPRRGRGGQRAGRLRTGYGPGNRHPDGAQGGRRRAHRHAGFGASPSSARPGPEPWHPNPDFYYLPGGGPLLDMGPYYISTLVTLLGPVASVTGAASHTRDTRTIGSGPRAGEVIPVQTDTHVTGVLVHASGALSTLYMSFDTVATVSARIEVHGEQGSLVVPDPNRFDGDVSLMTLGEKEWQVLPVSAGYVDSVARIRCRGHGQNGGRRRAAAGGKLAFHVLDVMESLLVSAREGRVVDVQSSCERPAPVPLQTIGAKEIEPLTVTQAGSCNAPDTAGSG